MTKRKIFNCLFMVATYMIMGNRQVMCSEPSNSGDSKIQLSNKGTRWMTDSTYLKAAEASHAGRDLQAKDAESLENTLQLEPDNLEPRLKLLGFYYKSHLWDSSSRSAAMKHISWLVVNHPESIALMLPETTTALVTDRNLDEKLTAKWENVISHNKTNPLILRNAAAFLRFHHKERAAELIALADSLERQK